VRKDVDFDNCDTDIAILIVAQLSAPTMRYGNDIPPRSFLLVADIALRGENIR
jgi:hypothetical protein